jgi:imidazolonepropionase-like amidohydrolase
MPQIQYIKVGSLIDGSGDAVRRNVFLSVQDGVITNIGPAAELPEPDKTVIDDLSRCTIVPPLVDCSVSLAQSPSVDEKVRVTAERSALVARHLHYCHLHGVLGVAAIDDFAVVEEQGRENIDIRTAGRNFLRINYSGSIDDTDPSDPLLNQKDLRNLLKQRGDKKAVVVANGAQQVREALEVGCDAIEQGYGMGEDNLCYLAKRNVLWIPSVIRSQNALQGAASGGEVMCRFSIRYVGPGKADPGTEAFWKKMLAEQLEQLRLAREMGVKTAVGTGAGSVGILHGESVVEEIKLFIKAGWTLEQAIRCASDRGARFFNLKNPGILAVGSQATFLVAKGTVQQLPRKLAYLENVYVEGKPTF